MLIFCTHVHTYSDRVVTGSGHCSVLSVVTPLSVSPIRPASTPLPVCVCVCVTLRSLHGQTKKLRPLNCSHLSTVSCYRGCFRGKQSKRCISFLAASWFSKTLWTLCFWIYKLGVCACVLRADLGLTQKEKRHCHIQDLWQCLYAFVKLL